MISVCVASHDRPLRLRWLLNALGEQEGAAFEVVVAHDGDEETEALLAGHPAVTRHVRLPRDSASPGRNRNAAWGAATGDLVVFTDDDCRPAPGWLAALAAAPRDAVLQGVTRPDPDERHLVAVGGWRSQDITPPTPWGQACNIAYPRALLEALDGFDEALDGGEDTDLLQRALAGGARQVAVPEAVVWHAVEIFGAPQRARRARRFRHLPAVVARHPGLRRALTLGVFQTPRHAALVLALAGLLLRRPWLALPWARLALPAYGPHPRGRLRAAAELPVCLLDDAVELGWLVRGSFRARSPVL